MNDFKITQEQTLIKPSFFTKIGNRYFTPNGHSFLNAMIGLPVTLLVYIYSYIQILLYTIKYFTQNELQYAIPIANSFTFLINLYLILQVSFSNPGIYLPSKEITNDPAINVMIATIAKQELFLKFCRTCHIAKDLRVFHCSQCNVCILRHDHHCPWLSICIGINNHKKFLVLLPVTILYLIQSFITLICLLVYTQSIQGDIIVYEEMTLAEIIICSILCGLVITVFFFVSPLIYFQSYYISINQTTSENIKKLPNSINPYTLESSCLNIKEFFNDPLGYKNRTQYNANSQRYLDKLVLLSDKIQQDKEKKKPSAIKETLTEMSFHYDTETETKSTNSSKQDLIEEIV